MKQYNINFIRFKDIYIPFKFGKKDKDAYLRFLKNSNIYNVSGMMYKNLIDARIKCNGWIWGCECIIIKNETI
jgi:hypothetical protein